MNILFVCRQNVGRSQIAQALYTKKTNLPAASAGTQVDIENQKISERPLAKPVIELIKEEEIDVSQNTTNQVTPEMITRFDRIIVMAESETIPPFLSQSSKTILWIIEDPAGKDYGFFREIISQIKAKINELQT